MTMNKTCMWLALLLAAAAVTTALPVPGTGSGGGELAGAMSTDDNSTLFDCSAPLADDAEATRRIYSALEGLRILELYTDQLFSSTRAGLIAVIGCPLEVTAVNSVPSASELIRVSPQDVADWIAILTTYAEVAQENCDDRTLTILSLLEEIIGDLYSVLEPHHCNCENDIDTESTCFTVPEPYPLRLRNSCNQMNYVIFRVESDAIRASYLLDGFLSDNYSGQDAVAISLTQWISAHDITSENTPDYDVLLQLE